MTGINTGINKVDPAAQFSVANKVFRFYKSYWADSYEQSWWLIADNSTVHCCTDTYGSVAPTTIKRSLLFSGGLIHTFGLTHSFDPLTKRNFAVAWPLYTTTQDYPSSSGSHRHGFYYAGTLPVSQSGFMFLDTPFNSELKIVRYAPTPLFTLDGATRFSGVNTSFILTSNLNYLDLVTDVYSLYGNFLNSYGTGVFGKCKEVKFFHGGGANILGCFDTIEIDNKKYINLFTGPATSTGRAPTTFNIEAGTVPFLICQTWD